MEDSSIIVDHFWTAWSQLLLLLKFLNTFLIRGRLCPSCCNSWRASILKDIITLALVTKLYPLIVLLFLAVVYALNYIWMILVCLLVHQRMSSYHLLLIQVSRCLCFSLVGNIMRVSEFLVNAHKFAYRYSHSTFILESLVALIKLPCNWNVLSNSL